MIFLGGHTYWRVLSDALSLWGGLLVVALFFGLRAFASVESGALFSAKAKRWLFGLVHTAAHVLPAFLRTALGLVGSERLGLGGGEGDGARLGRRTAAVRSRLLARPARVRQRSTMGWRESGRRGGPREDRGGHAPARPDAGATRRLRPAPAPLGSAVAPRGSRVAASSSTRRPVVFDVLLDLKLRQLSRVVVHPHPECFASVAHPSADRD
jgi:hypothetical protein